MEPFYVLIVIFCNNENNHPPPSCQNKIRRKKNLKIQYVLNRPKKGFSFGISASIKIGQGSQLNLYVGFSLQDFEKQDLKVNKESM